MPLQEDIQKLGLDEIIDLFEMDLSSLGDTTGPHRFHNQWKTGVSADITFNSLVYNPMPIQITGIDISGTGRTKKPEMQVNNLLGSTVATLVDSYGDLRGGTVTRRRTQKKYLDGEPSADPTQVYPEAVFTIEQKTNDTPEVVTFQLADPTDLTGRQIGRLVSGINCIHAYRDGSCQYAGDPVEEFDETTIPGPHVDRGLWDGITTYAAKDYVHRLDEHGIPHVFSSKQNGNLNNRPPNSTWWYADQCNKTLARCKRTGHTTLPAVPYGAEPALGDLPPV